MFVLRDYTKSMKHYWHEAAFIPELADAGAAWRVAARFRELRADDFVGGFVLRPFEAFTGQWRVVEIGDGQVSDYPAGAPTDALIAALNANDG